MDYGARAPGRPGTTLTLGPGQSVPDITLRLSPQGVIAGRVLDEDGDPVRGVYVRAMRFAYTTGRRQLVPTASGNTNDLGEYRIADVSPGKYYLNVVYNQPRLQSSEDRSAVPRSEDDYVTTYYPRTHDMAGAVQLTVTPGAQLRNLDITLAKAHTAMVSGKLVNDSPAPLRNFSVTLISGNVGEPNLGSPVDSEGNFHIRRVPAGSYTLIAHGNEGMKSYTSRRPIEVGSGDIDDVTLAVGPGVTVTGRVHLDGDTGALPPSVQVSLLPYDSMMPVFGPLPNGKLSPDGTFRFEAVTPTRYSVNISGLLDGFYARSIRSGNVDVLANGLEIGGMPPEALDIVVSPNAPQLTGLVQDANQQPLSGATVVLIPQEKERRERGALFRTTNSDASGRFSMRGIVPGEYKVFAWDDVERGMWFDASYMAALEGKGAAVSLKDGSKESVQVTVIPPNDR